MTRPRLTAARSILPPLFVIQFLSWSGMFCLWIYAVPVIAHQVLHAAPETAAYRSALITVSACFALYAVLGAALSFAVPAVVARFGNGVTHGAALLIGGAGIAALGLVGRPAGLALAFPLIGIGWASMSNIPYAIASAAAPEGRGAHFLRVFGLSTVIPQVAVTLGLAVFAPAWRTRFDLPADPW